MGGMGLCWQQSFFDGVRVGLCLQDQGGRAGMPDKLQIGRSGLSAAVATIAVAWCAQDIL